jgi:PA14 domain./Fibronectin type III domain./Filamin/ABP280 repeat.
LITVTTERGYPDEHMQCSWTVTFEEKAGNIPALKVSTDGALFSTTSVHSSGDTIIIQDNYIKGTSDPISGLFTLELNGQRTPYLSYDATETEMREALRTLNSIHDVQVKRSLPNVNLCYTWFVTFTEQMGDVPLLIADFAGLKGTAPFIFISEDVAGENPSFDGPDYGSITSVNMTNLSTEISGLKQGILYFFRVTAFNAIGNSQPAPTVPSLVKPMPRAPFPPERVHIRAIDRSSVEVTIEAPKDLDPGVIDGYKIEFAKEPFQKDRQRVSLICPLHPEIQRVSTVATDLREVQYVIINSKYRGNGIVNEVQRITCDASGGYFSIIFNGEYADIPYDADGNQIKAALESLNAIGSVSVHLEDGSSTACRDGGNFTISFESTIGISGDLPLLKIVARHLVGMKGVTIETLIQGDSPVLGSFSLAFRGARTNPIQAFQAPTLLKKNIQHELTQLDTIGINDVVVNHVPLSEGGLEMIFSVEFSGAGVAGNVPPIEVIETDKNLTGSGADVFVISDGQTFTASNGINSITALIGNSIRGSFHLEIGGHVSEAIPYNSSTELMKTLLEAIPSVGLVDVFREKGKIDGAYIWTITFLSSPGTFPAIFTDYDVIKPLNNLFTLRSDDLSANVLVEVIQEGEESLRGNFVLSFNDQVSVHNTSPLEAFISALELKHELQKLPNVGLVAVQKNPLPNGISWDIEFIGCATKELVDVCNEGNLTLLIATNLTLSGCGGAHISVEKIVEGTKAGICPDLNEGACSYSYSNVIGGLPQRHLIQNLDVGQEYFFQAKVRTKNGYSLAQISSPSSVIPVPNEPSAPPPPYLINSTAKSITVGWDLPDSNGGSPVYGFELWMDDINGGGSRLVFNGIGQPSIFHHELKTQDVSTWSQMVEAGRQYQFVVRATNQCRLHIGDETPCFSPFSAPQSFIIRAPQPPQPPPAPSRDSKTGRNSSVKTSISVYWSRPIDNGGSPITGYAVYIKDSIGSISNVQVHDNVYNFTFDGLHQGGIYHIHVIAYNMKGRSGQSPSVSVIAATVPGFGVDYQREDAQKQIQPRILDISDTSITISWDDVFELYNGGTPIVAYKIYVYQGLSISPNFAKQEVQHVTYSGIDDTSVEIGGTFTLYFDGHQTENIPANASSYELETFLCNLEILEAVEVSDINNGWAITFLSSPGDLPLMQVTSGKLIAPERVKLVVSEVQKGDNPVLMYTGSVQSKNRTLTVGDLPMGEYFIFKVAASNAVGDGVLSFPSSVTKTQSGASAEHTTASGGALHRGFAGTIFEVQAVSFATEDCSNDQLLLAFDDNKTYTPNLCGASAQIFEKALEALPLVGDIQVTRTDFSTPQGIKGFTWKVTFLSQIGDCSLLKVDTDKVQSGIDRYGESGYGANFVVEHLKGRRNEFTVEPKKSTGAAIQDIELLNPIQRHEDLFFTELWSSNTDVIDGSHIWHADGGIAAYNPVQFEKQLIVVPKNAGIFQLTMDTSTGSSGGRLEGYKATTRSLNATTINGAILSDALSSLVNIGQVKVSMVNVDHELHFVVTFISVFGEMPQFSSSNPAVKILREPYMVGVTEVQTITISANRPFVSEVQIISVPSSSSNGLTFTFQDQITNKISYDFSTVQDAWGVSKMIGDALNNLNGVHVDVSVVENEGGDLFNDVWTYKVTFLEPVGDLPLVQSDVATASEFIQGYSPLNGTFVLSYEGYFTNNIPFDSSALNLKSSLECLDSIEEVNVKKHDIKIGYKWEISFTKNMGNLRDLKAYNVQFEVQKLSAKGGHPTPLGGRFYLSYGEEYTHMLPHDATEHMLKEALEKLPSIKKVDVLRIDRVNGQCDWMITFHIPESPLLLVPNGTSITGSLDRFTASVVSPSKYPSLISPSGSTPNIVVEEKVPGLPSYTGWYHARYSGFYSLAVCHLQKGGLTGWYYNNQWFSGKPDVKRVDSNINFNWETGWIFSSARDFVSIRWWGKIRPESSGEFLFYLRADDGARLFIDHVLIIDCWNGSDGEMRGKASLSDSTYHDIKIEYKEEIGAAHLSLQWSSKFIPKQNIPKDQLYFATHISGSPFHTEIIASASDYPYSDLLPLPGKSMNETKAGELTYFIIQAKDAYGNVKASPSSFDALQDPAHYFTVDIIGDNGVTSAKISNIEGGRYRVEYTLLKAGDYVVHVRVGGTDIYCGKGEAEKCSPFRLRVDPGHSVASMSEAESRGAKPDFMVEARAGETGMIYLQAKDTFGNNRITGGDKVQVIFKLLEDKLIQYRGYVEDNGDGTYFITYAIPIAGQYSVLITLNNEPVKHCIGHSMPFIFDRIFDGLVTYESPPTCDQSTSVLTVIHNKLHASSCTLESSENNGLEQAYVGIETGFLIKSNDKFGNLRVGAETAGLNKLGDGTSDIFIITLEGPGGYTVRTSSAVLTLRSLDSSVDGYFRLKVGEEISEDLPHNITGSALQTVLMSMKPLSFDFDVCQTHIDGNIIWSITFLSNFEEWGPDIIKLIGSSNSSFDVSNNMKIEKIAKAGQYPINYKLWKTGTYTLTITSLPDSSLVSGATYIFEVVNGAVDATTSQVSLMNGTAGQMASFYVLPRDSGQQEIQSIKTWDGGLEGSFRLLLFNKSTTEIPVDASAAELADALNNLSTAYLISVTKVMTGICQKESDSNSFKKCGSNIWTITFVRAFSPCMSTQKHESQCFFDGDIDLLKVDDSGLSKIVQSDNIHQVVTTYEVQKGSLGNNYTSLDVSKYINAYLQHSFMNNVTIEAESINKIENGLYKVYYKPLQSGYYVPSILINGTQVTPAPFMQVYIDPSIPDAIKSVFSYNLAVKVGEKEVLSIMPYDRFGNMVTSHNPSMSEFFVKIVATPHHCGGSQSYEENISSTNVLPEKDGTFAISYVPSIAGQYDISVLLRSKGGLLTTFFYNPDFSHPVLRDGLNGDDKQDYWCLPSLDCDSTQLSLNINFDWGLESPLSHVPLFPIDHFSVKWHGHISVPITGSYQIILRSDGGTRLTIGELVLIDSLSRFSSDTLLANIYLEKGSFYSFILEYVHTIDEAYLQLFWETPTAPKHLIPKDAFFYSRNLGSHISKSSKILVSSAPGDIHTNSSAEGVMKSCVSMEECSFVIQAKDTYGNNLYSLGQDSHFVIEMIGFDDWASKGRVNDDISLKAPIKIIPTLQNHGWEKVGIFHAHHMSKYLKPNSTDLLVLQKGDSLSIDGHLYTAAHDYTSISNVSLELEKFYLGKTSNVQVFRANRYCESGRSLVRYRGMVRGQYQLDVRLPERFEVQRVSLHSTLSYGTFILSYYDTASSMEARTNEIHFNSSGAYIQNALRKIPVLKNVEVSIFQCLNPQICSWDVTFVGLLGNIGLLQPHWSIVKQDVNISVRKIHEYKESMSINGFPTFIKILPGPFDPGKSTVYGSGLYESIAGRQSTFYIQPKDSYGNDLDSCEGYDTIILSSMYPESWNGDHTLLVNGTVSNHHDCPIKVTYTPFVSGRHTLVILAKTATEIQSIRTGFTSINRGGTFTLFLDQTESPPIPWNATGNKMASIMSKIKGIGNVTISREVLDELNFEYFVTFNSATGDIPTIDINTSFLLGSDKPWIIKSTSNNGQFKHVAANTVGRHDTLFSNEIQRISVEVSNKLQLSREYMTLNFMCYETELLPLNVSSKELKDALEALPSVGNIAVNKTSFELQSVWDITFLPSTGQNAKNIFNFGPLTMINVIANTSVVDIEVLSLQSGYSAFHVNVTSSDPDLYHTHVTDMQGMPLTADTTLIGFYKETVSFQLQLQDRYGNVVNGGPQPEIQIIETFSNSSLGGDFVLAFGEHNTITLSANTNPFEMQLALMTFDGLGSPRVFSNSARSIIHGKTVTIKHGSNIAIPSDKISEFDVGDWIRIGDIIDGPIFTIIEMKDAYPYYIKLSHPYKGPTLFDASFFQHQKQGVLLGYQYIIQFDPQLGDIRALTVSGSKLTGEGSGIKIIACDRNRRHELILSSNRKWELDGYFTIILDDVETSPIYINANSDEIVHHVTNAARSIYSVIVDYILNTPWEKHIVITLISDEVPMLVHASSRFMTCGENCTPSLILQSSCPYASNYHDLLSTQTHFGRKGQHFVVTLEGPQNVRGTVSHHSGGGYIASYETPKVGKYLLNIESVSNSGLLGEYFSNRWLFGQPMITRTDETVDFYWAESDAITSTGKDFISVRWSGYVRPLFSEKYTFVLRVNDGVKVWIDDAIMLDEYDKNVPSHESYFEYNFTLAKPFLADELVPIKIEFRENQGDALIHLLWKSDSQELTVIHKNFLYSNPQKIKSSPFTVEPRPIKPGSPTDCMLRILAWDQLEVLWRQPKDTGGDSIVKYLIEYWDNRPEMYGEPDIQRIRFSKLAMGKIFSVFINNETHIYPLKVGSNHELISETIQSILGVGRVSVNQIDTNDSIDYVITFIENVAPVNVIQISNHSFIPRNSYCVCARALDYCVDGSYELGCNSLMSKVGNISTSHIEALTSEIVTNGTYFQRSISNLIQSSAIKDGFGVRVSAMNSRGLGNPCQTVYAKPQSRPEMPIEVRLMRDPSSISSLLIYVAEVLDPRDRGSKVHSYLVEYSTEKSFMHSNNLTLPIESLQEQRFYSQTTWFLQCKIENLKPGLKYYVKVAAINDAGISNSLISNPESLEPGSKPSIIPADKGVILSTLSPQVSSILESSTSLVVDWQHPTSDNGFQITEYMIETWISDGKPEIQQIEISMADDGEQMTGSFSLEYRREKTILLPINATNELFSNALSSWSFIRSIDVNRNVLANAVIWTVTFLTEFPSSNDGETIQISEISIFKGSNLVVQPQFKVSVLSKGSEAVDYKKYKLVPSPNSTEGKRYQKILTGLIPGQKYCVYVCASNKLGLGTPQKSNPGCLSPLRQKPDFPAKILIAVHSSKSLKVEIFDPESNGGETVLQYKVEWDVSDFFNSTNGSPLGHEHIHISKDTPTCKPCTYIISSLITGQPYHVRVYAYNLFGYSHKPKYSDPHVLAPKTQAKPPASLAIYPTSQKSVRAVFPRSNDNGGQNITKYRVEWLSLMQTNKAQFHLLQRLYMINPVQSIKISAVELALSGYFYISFENHVSQRISINADANEMKLKLEMLPTVGSLHVTRVENGVGHEWFVTFLSYATPLTNSFENRMLLTGSFDQPFNYSSVLVTKALNYTNVKLEINQVVNPFDGFEQQQIETFCRDSMSQIYGTFQLSLHSKTTGIITHNTTADELQKKLEYAFETKVLITRATNLKGANTFTWTIVFLDIVGDLPLMEVDEDLHCSDNEIGYIVAREIISGRSINEGISPSGFIEVVVSSHVQSQFYQDISDLDPDNFYHFRVYSWNGFENKFGASQHSSPAALSPVGIPDPPQNIVLRNNDGVSLYVTWGEDPNAVGSRRTEKYSIEWICDHEQANAIHGQSYLSSQYEIQKIIISGRANDIGGYFIVSYMGEKSPPIPVTTDAVGMKNALESMSTIDQVSVIKTNDDKNSQPTSSVINSWIITFVNQKGNLPSMLVYTGTSYPSTIAFGGYITGSSARIRVETLVNGHIPNEWISPDLRHCNHISVMISSFNGYFWSKAATSTFHGKLMPTTPSAPQNVELIAISPTAIVVQWEPPGTDGGDDVTQYSIQWGPDQLYQNKIVVNISSERNITKYSHTISNLDSEQNYYIRVIAYNRNGFSPPCDGSPSSHYEYAWDPRGNQDGSRGPKWSSKYF